MRTRKTVGLAYAVFWATLFAMPSSSLAVEETVSAFSIWTAKGQLANTAQNEATFVGALEGRVYVNTDEGPVEAGQMLCPAIVRIDTTSGIQTATGNCTITSVDGAQLFTELNCKGVHLVGCSGQTKVTGGTGRLQNAKGGGEFTIRSSWHTAKVSVPAGVELTPQGIMFWPELKYVLP